MLEAAVSGCGALFCHPRLAELAALLFGGAAPDAGFLVCGQGELEALAGDAASGADTARGLDLLERVAGDSDGKEHVGVRVATRRTGAPGVKVPIVSTNPGESHGL